MAQVKKSRSNQTSLASDTKPLQKNPAPKRLSRSEKNRMLGGVAGGLAEYFEVDPTLVRILFILLVIFGGSGVLIYLILWVIVPSESAHSSSNEDTINRNVAEIKATARNIGSGTSQDETSESRRNLGAMILIGIGVLFLLRNFGFLRFINWNELWPLVLVAVGVYLLFRRP